MHYLLPNPAECLFFKIWIKDPQIGSDMPSALGPVGFSFTVFYERAQRTQQGNLLRPDLKKCVVLLGG